MVGASYCKRIDKSVTIRSDQWTHSPARVKTLMTDDDDSSSSSRVFPFFWSSLPEMLNLFHPYVDQSVTITTDDDTMG